MEILKKYNLFNGTTLNKNDSDCYKKSIVSFFLLFSKKDMLTIIKNIRIKILNRHNINDSIRIIKSLWNCVLSPYASGYSILNNKLIHKIKKYEPILETFAGYGLNSKLLQLSGVKCIATDLYPSTDSYTKIIKIDAIDAVNKYTNHTLFICWPGWYSTSHAYDTLKVYQGNILIYIGEERDGAVGDSNFFNLLESEWTPVYSTKLEIYTTPLVKKHKTFKINFIDEDRIKESEFYKKIVDYYQSYFPNKTYISINVFRDSEYFEFYRKLVFDNYVIVYRELLYGPSNKFTIFKRL